jgi:hypothetical protein
MSTPSIARKALLLGVVFPALFSLQLLAQEVQVPLDDEARIEVITAEMERRLQLFPDYPTFEEARLYRLAEDSFELIIQYSEAGRSLRTRLPMNTGEVAALRIRVTERLVATRVLTDPFEDGGRVFLTTTTFLGGFYGVLLPAALGVEGEAAYTSMPLLGMAAGFGVPFMLTRGRPISQTEAVMTAYGGIQGAAHGLLVGLLLAGDGLSVQAGSGLALLGSAGQAGLGFAMAQRPDITAGVAESMSSSSLFGAGYGVMLNVLILGDAGFETERALAATLLAGSVGGSYAGYRVALDRNFTQGDARIWSLLGYLGVQTGSTVLLLADAEEVNSRLAAGVLLATTTGGLFLGERLVRNFAFTREQANVISLGTWAGALLGYGLSAAAEMDDRTTTTLGLLGAGAGFALTYGVLVGDARTARGDLRFSVSPYVPHTGGAIGRRSTLRDVSPMMQVQYRF